MAVKLQGEVIGVEDVIAHDLKRASVKPVCTAPAYQVVDSGALSIGSAVIGGLHFELLNSVRRWNGRAHLFSVIPGGVLREVVGVDAVELDVVQGCLGAIGGNILRSRAWCLDLVIWSLLLNKCGRGRPHDRLT